MSAAYGIISAISAPDLLDVFVRNREGLSLVHLVERERIVACFLQITMVRESPLHKDGQFLARREQSNRIVNLYCRGTKWRSTLLTLRNTRAKKQINRKDTAPTRRLEHSADANMHDCIGAIESCTPSKTSMPGSIAALP